MGALAKDSITWMVSDFPPYAILKGAYSGKGNPDEEIKLLQEYLPEYAHQILVANLVRRVILFKEGKKGCGALLKTSERKEYEW